MEIKNVEQKKEFYNSILKNKQETYVLCKDSSNNETVLYLLKNNNAPSGFWELNCHLFDYSFTPTDVKEIAFLKEQNYVIIDDRAYDIQTPFCEISFANYLGEFSELSKKDAVLLLKD